MTRSLWLWIVDLDEERGLEDSGVSAFPSKLTAGLTLCSLHLGRALQRVRSRALGLLGGSSHRCHYADDARDCSGTPVSDGPASLSVSSGAHPFPPTAEPTPKQTPIKLLTLSTGSALVAETQR